MVKDGEIIKLEDKSYWRVENESKNLYAYYPNVIICPVLGKLIIGENILKVQSLNSNSSNDKKSEPDDISGDIVVSNVSGEFEGWNGKTKIKLTNGQTWQQNQYYYKKHYTYMPKVFIFTSNGQYRMKVNGTNKSVGVKLVE